MTERKNIIDVLIVVMVLATVVISIFAMWRVGYQAGFNSAKSLVEKSRLGDMIRTPADVRALLGTVTLVGSGSLTLHVISNNPFDSSPSNRTVLVDASTKIIKIVQKDPKVFQSEVAVFSKAAQSGSTSAKNAPSPAPFTLTTVTLADIKVGDTITVTASSNIKSAKEFTAIGIQVQPRQIIPPTNP
ncbi:MAG: hypothetical protein Q8L52_04060 [bacterium]|nr:hypothetical protein [bacterium]